MPYTAADQAYAQYGFMTQGMAAGAMVPGMPGSHGRFENAQVSSFHGPGSETAPGGWGAHGEQDSRAVHAASESSFVRGFFSKGQGSLEGRSSMSTDVDSNGSTLKSKNSWLDDGLDSKLGHGSSAGSTVTSAKGKGNSARDDWDRYPQSGFSAGDAPRDGKGHPFAFNRPANRKISHKGSGMKGTGPHSAGKGSDRSINWDGLLGLINEKSASSPAPLAGPPVPVTPVYEPRQKASTRVRREEPDRGRGKKMFLPQPEKEASLALRFERGDRIVCNLGELWIAGTVLDCHVSNPEGAHLARIPYVVKTDAFPGKFESRTISAPSDTDGVVCRERCFNHNQEDSLARWCAPAVTVESRKPLRFADGDRVAIRVKDLSGGYENWMLAGIVSTWTEMPLPSRLGNAHRLKPHVIVPYVLMSEGREVFYCHRDDHTLIRKPEHVPQIPLKSISKRFEKRRCSDGTVEMFDHVTLRSKPANEDDGSDSD